MSSRSELLRRGGPALLFTLVIGASAFVHTGILPVSGWAPLTPSVTKPVDAAMALMRSARRPFDQVTLCDPLKAYAPDLAPLANGAELVAQAPPRPVILCPTGAADFPDAVSRARRDGLTWVREIGDTGVLAFAADEGRFRAAVGQAGLTVAPADLRPASPALLSLRSSASGVVREERTWRIPAHGDDGLVLYGPYLDLTGGAYRMRLHARLQGSPDQCRDALRRFRPEVAVTQDSGRGGVQPKAPATVVADAGDACGLTVEDAFTVAAGGAKTVETPFYGATTLPMIVDAYALEPAASAQSR